MDYSLLTLAVLTGIAGAPHCTIMCGGIVSGVALNAEAGAARTVLIYNLGRVTMYTLLGAIMGGIGSFLNGASKLAGIQGAAAIAGGVFILLWAHWKYELPVSGGKLLRWPPLERLTRMLRLSKDYAAVWASGLLLGFIPCGLTYAMQMNAAASGGAGSGASIMAAFGLATVPTLMIVGLTAGAIRGALRRRMMQVGRWLAYAMGILCILRGLAANGWIPSIHPWLW